MRSPVPLIDALEPDRGMLPSPAGGERIHARATVPFKARIHSEWYRVENIGMGGFAIKHPFPTQVTTLPSIVELSLFLNDVTIAITVPVREVWNDVNGVRSFEFVSLSRHQAAMLNRLVEDYLARQVTVIDDLIKKPASANGAAVTAQTADPRRRFPWLGMTLSLAIAVLSVLVAAPLFSVRSGVAAVSIAGATLRAPATGVLEGETLKVGAAVARGDTLFNIRTSGGVTQFAASTADQERLANELREQQVQGQGVRQLAKHLGSVANARLHSIRAKITAIDAQIATARSLLARMQTLTAKGYVSKMQEDTQKIAVETLRRNREEAVLERIAAESDVNLAASGSLRTDLSSSAQTREVMDARIAEAESAVSAGERRLDALGDVNRIVSPCDCMVQAIFATPGSVVSAGSPVYALRPRTAPAQVDAMVSSSRVHELRVGALAIVALPDRWVRGRVDSVSYLGASGTRLGLPAQANAASLVGSEGMALAIVTPVEPLDATQVGSPARVYIASNPMRAFLARIAMVLF
jgi:multidrug resistance efflux pump